MTNRLIGNYRVIRLLGEGGMGLVYEAVRDDIGVRAAIKVLRPEFAHNAETAGRFINEARAVNMVQHPGVVRVFDYGQLPTGEAYLAMEFLDGDSLRQRINRYLRISEADTIRLARQIASAVAAAHAKQIVHRDLKPDHVTPVAGRRSFRPHDCRRPRSRLRTGRRVTGRVDLLFRRSERSAVG